MTSAALTEDFKTDPYWWEAAPRPKLSPRPLPAAADVAIVGSGYTGLSAALDLVRGGASVVVIDAADPGAGASSRSTGSVGRTFRHAFSGLLKQYGPERAVAVYTEVANAFSYTTGLMEGERLNCGFARRGRFTGAATPKHYAGMQRELEVKSRYLPSQDTMLPADRQSEEIGFGGYHGGLVIPDVASIHSGLYQLELLRLATAAGATVVANTPVTGIRREGASFVVEAGKQALRARDVIVATNGYTSAVTKAFQRRVIPFPAFIAATEPLDPALIAAVLPGRRVFQESLGNPFFMRVTPDGTRLLFGGLTGTLTSDLRDMGQRLHAAMTRIAPQLAQARFSHTWTGKCAATFSIYPHVGVQDGIHYAMGYCFAGISMGTYLGHKVAQRLLGSRDHLTAFDTIPFETRPYHLGRAWFLPIAVGLINWRDRKAMRA